MFCCSPLCSEFGGSRGRTVRLRLGHERLPWRGRASACSGGSSAVEARMERMEKMVFGLQKNMENFLALRKGDPQSLSAKSKSQRKAVGTQEADERSSRVGPVQIAGLDPSVVAAARKAGVGEAELQRLGSMVSRSHKLGDAPGTSRKPIMAVDSEEEEEVESEEAPEEEEELVEDRQNSMGDLSMQKAVMKLTKIVDSFAAQKKAQGPRRFVGWSRRRSSRSEQQLFWEVKSSPVQEASSQPSGGPKVCFPDHREPDGRGFPTSSHGAGSACFEFDFNEGMDGVPFPPPALPNHSEVCVGYSGKSTIA